MKYITFFLELCIPLNPYINLEQENTGKSNSGGVAYSVKMHITELLLY